jgi:hypothetical protein
MGKLLNISCFSIKCHASDCEFDWFIMIYHLSYVLYNRETSGNTEWAIKMENPEILAT